MIFSWFLGRKDDLLKSFGYRVSPHEVERVLKDHPDVADVAATGDAIAPRKLLVVVYVIPQAGSQLSPEGAAHRLLPRRVTAHPQWQDHAPRTHAWERAAGRDRNTAVGQRISYCRTR
jgi:acyl-coenzyme A synthetase/AMP-(fatty) acid ligase